MSSEKTKIVLVAEDFGQMDMLIDALEAGDHSVVAVKNLELASVFLSKNDINILILDIVGMPEKAGETIQELKKSNPGMSIIIITGQSESEITSSLMVDGIVSKPFRISHIEELIEKSLKVHSTEHSSSRNILVVDDDDIFRTLLIRSLKIANYNAVGASDGKMAIEILRDKEVSFVIADVNMPYLDGVSLLKQIKSTWPAIPVILITGYYSAGESPVTENATPDGFLMKPFKIQNIVELLDSISTK